ncbi:hypothetical protein SAY86_002793 [Trapa natans]|uniref:Bifunctional inhibitor/plant lipid transfer protein/seed storage helical domain-containing protein n=1 Tax=Trapa natans TaxID=22666 RepID=A0AAN7LKT3_TRANT|nr:hypothetical protein SAY86_002793 [Trapa natans]
MAASCSPSTTVAGAVFLVSILALVELSASDFAQDKAECMTSLLGLSPCLNYVSGENGAKAPTPDCCKGFRQVLSKSFKCVCVLIKDRNEPSIGITINTTLALGLPSVCQYPINVSQCIDLLKLDPNSTDAKVFSGFEKTLEDRNSTKVAAPVPPNVGSVQAEPTSDGWRMKPLPGALEVGLLGAVMLAMLGSCKWPSTPRTS